METGPNQSTATRYDALSLLYWLLSLQLFASLIAIFVPSVVTSALPRPLLAAAIVAAFAVVTDRRGRILLWTGAGLFVLQTLSDVLGFQKFRALFGFMMESPNAGRNTFFGLQMLTGLLGASSDLIRIGLTAFIAGATGFTRIKNTLRIVFIFRLAGTASLLFNLLFFWLIPIVCIVSMFMVRKDFSFPPRLRNHGKWLNLAGLAFIAAAVTQWHFGRLSSPEKFAADFSDVMRQIPYKSVDAAYGELKDDNESKELAETACRAGDLSVCTVFARYKIIENRDAGLAAFRDACMKGNVTACNLGSSFADDKTMWEERACELDKLNSCAFAGVALKSRGDNERAKEFFRRGCFEARPFLSCGDDVAALYGPGENEAFRKEQDIRTKTKLKIDKLVYYATKMKKDSGSWPDSVDQISKHKKGPPDELIDSWGEPFRIKAYPISINIASSGPDRKFDTADDVVYWTDWRDAARSFLKDPK